MINVAVIKSYKLILDVMSVDLMDCNTYCFCIKTKYFCFHSIGCHFDCVTDIVFCVILLLVMVTKIFMITAFYFIYRCIDDFKQ